jgi:hypothetical protein
MMSKALANIRNDVVKVVTMSVVSGFLSGKDLMDQTWQMELAYTLAGFALYELVLAQHVTEARFGQHTAMVANLSQGCYYVSNCQSINCSKLRTSSR